MYKLYGIPNCNTVKKARDFLEAKKIPYEFVDFKKTPPSLEDIERWQKSFSSLPVNKSGMTYRKFKEEFEALSEKAQKAFLIKNSSMIKRPILQKNSSVLAFGFKEEEYKQIKA